MLKEKSQMYTKQVIGWFIEFFGWLSGWLAGKAMRVDTR